jgi:hypothetical protein
MDTTLYLRAQRLESATNGFCHETHCIEKLGVNLDYNTCFHERGRLSTQRSFVVMQILPQFYGFGDVLFVAAPLSHSQMRHPRNGMERIWLMKTFWWSNAEDGNHKSLSFSFIF